MAKKLETLGTTLDDLNKLSGRVNERSENALKVTQTVTEKQASAEEMQTKNDQRMADLNKRLTEAENSDVSAILKFVAEFNKHDEAKGLITRLSALEQSRANILSVGTIITSMLPPAVFAEITADPIPFDPIASKWAPADSRSVEGSIYQKKTRQSRVPDLRGLFLRGLNVFDSSVIARNPDEVDPAPGRGPGSFQLDALQGHGHKYEVAVGGGYFRDGALIGGFGSGSYSSDRILEPRTIEKYGDVRLDIETRPKNAAVFYYIRIN